MTTFSALPTVSIEPFGKAYRAVPRPYFVARVAGLPTHAVTGLRCSNLDDALRDVVELDEKYTASQELISKLLHDEIAGVTDRKIRGALLQVRRKLYQGEAPDPKLLKLATTALQPSTRDEVFRAAAALELRSKAQIALRSTHASALAMARARFQLAVGDADFQKALLLSSPTLYSNVARYSRADPGRLSSRDEQVERGLLRYFTRATMKATPFARFCAVTEGAIVADDEAVQPFSFHANPFAKRGHVRLNKRLYGLFWEHLKARPTTRRSLVIELNPTVKADDERLWFLAALNGREVFQRLNRDSVLDAVVDHVRRNANATLSDLTEVLVADADMEATPTEAVAYLDALVNHGLLRFRSLIGEQLAEWDVPLCAALDAIDDDHCRRLTLLLRHLRQLVNRYADADVSSRRELTTQINTLVQEALTDVGISPALLHRASLYEDASTPARLILRRTSDVNDALTRLSEWIRLTLPIAYPRAEQATMRHFFEKRYGVDGRVPLLKFYEDYYREHFKAHLEMEARARRNPNDPEVRAYDLANPFGLARVRELRAASSRLTELMQRRWAESPNAAEVELGLEGVREAVDPVAAGAATELSYSASVFCQFVPPNATASRGALMVPDGRFYVGFGKYFSRFLYMLSPTLQERVLMDNETLAGDHVLAEISGDAHFNANLHPQLLPREIGYPTGDSSGAGFQIPATALDVEPAPGDAHSLQLVDRATGQRTLPVDLGFLNPRMRPPLYQLLGCFAPGGGYGVVVPNFPDPNAAPTTSDPVVSYRPRFVFGGSLVLSRRRWTVPGVLMPRQAGAEDDGDYFLRVDRWRRAHGIPSEVYVRVWPSRSNRPGPEPVEPTPPGNPPARNVHRPSRDWFKPQYVDFGSPVLVRLFARMPGNLPMFFLQIEEQYPDQAALPTFGEEAYVSELVVEVDVGAPVPH